MTRAPYLGNPHDSPIWEELADALDAAITRHAPMHSPHEGHSVIREELDELWEHVRADTGRTTDARKEAVQIAAMGLRYALDLCTDTGDTPDARVEAYVEDVGGPEGVTAAGLRAAMLGETPMRTEHRQECSCSVCYVKRP